jgi:DNA invertase Pin-like site-specific DNA recombinase
VLIGYMRVSTGEQSLDLQRDALEAAGCQRIYQDVCGGAVSESSSSHFGWQSDQGGR